MKKIFVLAAIFYLFFRINPIDAVEKYILFDLGTMGYDSSHATSINNVGVVAGQVNSETEFWYTWAARWIDDQGLLLDPISPTLQGNQAYVSAINDKNEIAGDINVGHDRPLGCTWNGDGEFQNAYGTGSAYDINNNSQLIGRSHYEENTFLCKDGECDILFSAYDLGGIYSSPFAINDQAQIVGSVSNLNGEGNSTSYAYLWENGILTDLNQLITNGYGGNLESAKDINNSGHIIGATATGQNTVSSYLLVSGDVTDLGFSGAKAINNLGQVVGNAYLYENNQLIDLNNIVEADVEFSDLHASDINDASQIAGHAIIDGAKHAVRLDPCAPAYYYKDSDNDGYGNLADEIYVCQPPDGYVTEFTDCDDSDASISPDASEIENSKDDNCDGQIDEGFSDPAINPSGDSQSKGGSGSSGCFIEVTRR